MTPTDYHPIRTSMMRNVHDRRFRHAHGDHAVNTWSTPRAPSSWKPRFGSYGAAKFIPQELCFGWDRMIITEELGKHSDQACADFMDRLCVFEDMAASIRRDRNPIIDLAIAFDPIGVGQTGHLPASRDIDREFVGSLYIHFGDTGIRAMGDRNVTGAYVNAARYPRGTTFGDIHFVANDRNWERAHEISFYDTVAEHQEAAVVIYEVSSVGDVKFDIQDNDKVFGNESNAYALLPLVKLGVDIAIGKTSGYEAEVRTEYFHGGPNVRPEYCRMDVMEVARRPDLLNEKGPSSKV